MSEKSCTFAPAKVKLMNRILWVDDEVDLLQPYIIYLKGKDYEVVASMGHVRDLPKARLSVDITNNFAPKYDIIKGKSMRPTLIKLHSSKYPLLILAIVSLILNF